MLNNWEKWGERAYPKKMLTKGHYYAGVCRNAHIARWDGEKFIHWREKFGNVFLEDIEYWDVDGHFDGFIPIFCIGAELPKPIDYEYYNAPYHIIVNGAKIDWEFSSISYEDVCKLTGMDPSSIITMSVAYAGDDLADKSFTANQHVFVRDNCIINAFYTRNG